MIQQNEKEIVISNQKMEFCFSHRDGLQLNAIRYLRNEHSENWLRKPVDFFVLEVLGEKIPSSRCRVTEIDVLKDAAQEGVTFALETPVWNMHIRVSLLSEKQESFTLLYQIGAKWEKDEQQEAFMHIPFFAEFGAEENTWYLSSNPVARPDGRSAMCLHKEFNLPICNIGADQKTGFSMEFRNYAGFISGWNQNRNCDLLAMQDEKSLKNNRLLLRLTTDRLADVFEVRFFSLENGWCEAFDEWRRRIRQKMDLSAYDREDLQWYKKVLYQHFAYAYSKEVFNYETMEFEPERLIEENRDLGGIDSIILWYQYPRLGVDERNQWDFNNDIPGGKAGVRNFCERAHAKGVKVFLPYKPWDIRESENSQSVVGEIVDLVAQTGIDGIWFDTMNNVPKSFRECIDAAKPGILFCTELHPDNTKAIEEITGSWDQHRAMDDMPEAFVLRYLFPENNAPATNRWAVGESKHNLIDRCIFNGTGIAVWQDIFGAWLPFGAEHKKKLKHWKEILLAHFDTYFGSNPIPLYPTAQKNLYANRFISDERQEIIYSVYNASDHEISGELLEVDAGYEIKDELWAHKKLTRNGNAVVGTIRKKEILIICLQKNE